ncbi:hypothetical protein K523DRAFT_358996 [Schizophyllum commune Tattone D]|nr:hypothetical protein K523DRAFT_358996 [Schizophyllum commune Tattone D]
MPPRSHSSSSLPPAGALSRSFLSEGALSPPIPSRLRERSPLCLASTNLLASTGIRALSGSRPYTACGSAREAIWSSRLDGSLNRHRDERRDELVLTKDDLVLVAKESDLVLIEKEDDLVLIETKSETIWSSWGRKREAPQDGKTIWLVLVRLDEKSIWSSSRQDEKRGDLVLVRQDGKAIWSSSRRKASWSSSRRKVLVLVETKGVLVLF